MDKVISASNKTEVAVEVEAEVGNALLKYNLITILLLYAFMF